jgi:WhiB family transcriptional regulator, redox-sensing transcriptional regulator
MPDDTTIADAARLLSPQLLQDARSDTARGWAARALCVGADPEAFFPPGDDPAMEARAICAACPVRGQCLAYAITADERFGIWAALIPNSGTPCAGGWSGVERPHHQELGPLRDSGTAAVARQDRRERPLVTADGPRRSGRCRPHRDDDTA